MLDIIFYSVFYWIGHAYLSFSFRQASSTFNVRVGFYRIWLFFLDIIALKLVPFKNNLSEYNRYPVILSFSILFYYICRHCLRNQYIYQYYIAHVYHPNVALVYFGHYYVGFAYSAVDCLLKTAIIYEALYIHFILGLFFLLGLSFLDAWYYYNNITDSTSEIFHKLVGMLFHFVR